MKSPEYVRDTARIWRRLLDENRAATPEEMRELAEVFSRGGFTDGYYTQRVDRRMLGVRSEADKADSRAQTPFTGLTRRIPIKLSATLCKGQPATLSLSDANRTVTVTGDIPMDAINAPLTPDAVERNLSKFGGTPYTVAECSVTLEEGLMLPLSRLNELRRRALQALEDAKSTPAIREEQPFTPVKPTRKRTATRSARFYLPEQITARAQAYFDCIYLPLHRYTNAASGVVMPPVIFDGDTEHIRAMLTDAKQNGAQYALVGNLGHLPLVRDAGLVPVGDYRLNVTNTQTVATLESMGVEEVILSPELTLPQIRDLGGNTSVIVYGRIPLMTLEKCVIRDLAGCDRCGENRVLLRDRRGIEFPVLREWEHRNIVCNSLPTGMSDRSEALAHAHADNRHFLFTVETPSEVDEVIKAYTTGAPLSCRVRRIEK